MGLKRALATAFLTTLIVVISTVGLLVRLVSGYRGRKVRAARLVVCLTLLIAASTYSTLVPGTVGAGLAGASPPASSLYVANNGASSGVSTITSYPTSSNGDVNPTATVASPGSLNEPYAAAFDHSGDLWVANSANNTVVEFTAGQLDSSSSPSPAVTLWSTASGSLLGPLALAFDSAGDLWVANESNGSVVEFTPGQLTASGSPTPAVTLSPSGLVVPDALAFDSAGDLWVADFTSNAVIELTPAQLGEPGSSSPTPAVTLTSTSANSLDGPTALAFDSSGLWVANNDNNTVAEFSLGQLSTSGPSSPAPTATLTSTATDSLDGPRSLAFDQSGDLWVANLDNSTFNSTVAEFTLGQLSTPGPSSPAPAVTLTSTAAGSLDGPSLTFSPSGDLWVANLLNNTLAEFTPGQLTTPGPSSPAATVTLGSTAGGLDGALGLAFDSSGHLWAANRNNNTVTEFSASQLGGGLQSPAVTLSSTAAGSLNQPAGIAFDSSGDLWVGNWGNGANSTLVEFTPSQLATGSPTPAVTLSSKVVNIAGGSIDGPVSLTFDSSGDLWVANENNSTVVEFTPDELDQSGSPAPAVVINQLEGIAVPFALAFGAGGELWVANLEFNNVVGFAPVELSAASPAPTVTLNSPAFNGVQGMAFDPSGDLWLSNSNANSLVELDPGQLGTSSSSVTPAATISGAGTGLDAPTGIAIESTPSAPAGVTAAPGDTKVTLSWGAVTGASSYVVFDATSSGAEDYSAPAACTSTTTSCSVGSLSNGAPYYFTVEALGPFGASPPSAEVSAAPLASSLYVANFGVGNLPSTVTSYPTVSNGDVSPTGSLASPASLGAPDGLAFDHSGDLWVVDILDNSVVEYAPGQLATSGSPAPAVTLWSTTDGSLEDPAAVAFDSAGDLWVADAGNGSVVEFTPGQLTMSGSPAPAVTLFPSGLVSPSALAFNSTGDLWVADSSTGSVVELTPSQLSASSSPTPAETLSPSGLVSPFALAFDSSGNLWVADYSSSTVVELTPGQLAGSGSRSPAPAVTLTSTAAASLNGPDGLVFDASGNLWVANYNTSTVAEFTPGQLTTSGSPTPAGTLTSTMANSLDGPVMTLSASGDLWVANYNSNTVAEFTPGQLSTSGSPVPAVTLGSTAAGLAGPDGLAFDSSGDLWVANLQSDTVVEFTPGQLSTGSQTPAITLSSTSSGSLDEPAALAFDSRGDLWVANFGNGQDSSVVEFTPGQLATGSPTPVVTLSATSNSGGARTISLPDGLAFDSSGDLWVANLPNSTVAEFTPSELGQSGSPEPAVDLTQSSGIARPAALAFGPEGDLWVANETNNSVVAFDPGQLSAASPAPTVTLTSTAFAFGTPGGMAFDSSGELWLSTSGNSVVALDPSQLGTSGAVTPAATISGTGTSLDNPEGIAIADAPTTAPITLSASAGDAQVSLSWAAMAGAISYQVFDATSPGGEDYSGSPACTTATTNCTAPSLTNGTQYYFTVEAVGPGGASPPSAEVSATPQGPAPTTTTTGPATTTSVPPASSTTTTGSVPTTTSHATTTTAVPASSGGTPVTTTATTTTTTTTPAGFPGAGVSHPNGAIVDYANTIYVFVGGRAFAASARALSALEKVDHAEVVTALPGAVPPTAAAPRAGTLITTKAVNGNPTVYVVGTSGELYGFASSTQFTDGGFDPDLIVTAPSLTGLRVASTSATAAGISAFSTSADGGIVDSDGTFYVFAGGKAFRIPNSSALSTLKKTDAAKILSDHVTSARTSAPIAGGVLLSLAGGPSVFVSYNGEAYPFRTMAQLYKDGYGGTSAVPVPGTEHLADVFTYLGS